MKNKNNDIGFRLAKEDMKIMKTHEGKKNMVKENKNIKGHDVGFRLAKEEMKIGSGIKKETSYLE